MIAVQINEKLVFNCILKDPNLILKLDKNYFISDIGKTFFKVLKELFKNKTSFIIEHIVILGNKINSKIDNNILDNIKIDFEIEKFNFYLDELKKEYCKKDIQKLVLEDLLKETSIKNSFNIDKVEKIASKITSNILTIKNNKITVKTTNDLTETLKKTIIDRLDNKNQYQTGCSYLDAYFKLGLLPSEQTTIFSDSGIGKTTFKQMIILKRIFKNLPTLDVNLELDESTYTQRFYCNLLNKPSEYFYPDKEGILNGDVLADIEYAKKTIFESPYYRYLREDNLPINELEDKIINFKLETGVNSLVVFLDVATRLADFNEGNNFAVAYEKAVKRLSNVALRQNVHFVNIVHTNRDWENVKINKIEDIDKLNPNLRAIKNSSAFEKDSRLILGLMRKKFYMDRYFPEDPLLEVTDDIMDVIALKYNEGNLFRLKYLFNGDRFKITKFIEEENEES